MQYELGVWAVVLVRLTFPCPRTPRMDKNSTVHSRLVRLVASRMSAVLTRPRNRPRQQHRGIARAASQRWGGGSRAPVHQAGEGIRADEAQATMKKSFGRRKARLLCCAPHPLHKSSPSEGSTQLRAVGNLPIPPRGTGHLEVIDEASGQAMRAMRPGPNSQVLAGWQAGWLAGWLAPGSQSSQSGSSLAVRSSIHAPTHPCLHV